MHLVEQKDILAQLRLFAPSSPACGLSSVEEFFVEMSKPGHRYEIALLSPFNSPEPYRRLVDSLPTPSHGKHRLRLITSLKDQGHFPAIKGILNSAAKKLDCEIRVLPDPANNPAPFPDDSLHAKLFVLAKQEQDSDRVIPIEAFFGSANFTWRGFGLPQSSNPSAHHYWELVARMADEASRAAALELFEICHSHSGIWKAAAYRKNAKKP